MKSEDLQSKKKRKSHRIARQIVEQIGDECLDLHTCAIASSKLQLPESFPL